MQFQPQFHGIHGETRLNNANANHKLNLPIVNQCEVSTCVKCYASDIRRQTIYISHRHRYYSDCSWSAVL